MTSLEELPKVGPSARFPLASAHIAREALFWISDVVTARTDAWIGVARGVHEDDRRITHVGRYFDLRVRREFWRCQRCLAERAIAVPGVLDQRWMPWAKKEEAQAYGELAWSFINRHADCETGEPGEPAP